MLHMTQTIQTRKARIQHVTHHPLTYVLLVWGLMFGALGIVLAWFD